MRRLPQAILTMLLALASGCASTSIEYGVSSRAQTYVEFGSAQAVLRSDPPRVAVLPTVAVGGNASRDIAMDLALDRAIRRPELDTGLDLGFVPKEARGLQVIPHEVVLNRAVASGRADALRTLEQGGDSEIPDAAALRSIGRLVDVEYLLMPRLVAVDTDNAGRFTFAGLSFIRTGWTSVEAVLQLWHAPTGRLVWQSAGQVNLVRENVVGTSPSIQSAFDAILSTLVIDLATGRATSLIRGKTEDPATTGAAADEPPRTGGPPVTGTTGTVDSVDPRDDAETPAGDDTTTTSNSTDGDTP